MESFLWNFGYISKQHRKSGLGKLSTASILFPGPSPAQPNFGTSSRQDSFMCKINLINRAPHLRLEVPETVST